MEPSHGTAGSLVAEQRQQRGGLLLLHAQPERAAELTRGLSVAGFDVVGAPLSLLSEAWLAELSVEIIIVLPPEDSHRALDACRAARAGSDLPLVVLSARADELTITRAFAAGVDEYLVEPIGDGELAVRLDAILRRQRRNDGSGAQQVEGVVLSPVDHSVEVQGKKVRLSPMEFRLLSCLVAAPRKVLTHQTLMARVWGAEYVDSRHYLRLYVRYLREKLEDDPANPQMIISEWGVGYRFEPPLSRAVQ